MLSAGLRALAGQSGRRPGLAPAGDRAPDPREQSGEASRSGASEATLVVERPPAGLARGKYPASAWFIGLLGGLALISVAAYFVVRLRSRKSP